MEMDDGLFCIDVGQLVFAHHNHLSAGRTGIECAVSLLYLVEPESARGFCLDGTGFRPFDNLLERYFVQRIFRGAIDERAAEETQVSPAWHVHKRIKIFDRRMTAKKACHANTSAATDHLQGLQHRAVAD